MLLKRIVFAKEMYECEEPTEEPIEGTVLLVSVNMKSKRVPRWDHSENV